MRSDLGIATGNAVVVTRSALFVEVGFVDGPDQPREALLALQDGSILGAVPVVFHCQEGARAHIMEENDPESCGAELRATHLVMIDHWRVGEARRGVIGSTCVRE